MTDCDVCRFRISGTTTCSAFPNKIPAEILSGRRKHNKPYSGDHGIRFEEINERWRLLAVVWGGQETD